MRSYYSDTVANAVAVNKADLGFMGFGYVYAHFSGEPVDATISYPLCQAFRMAAS